MEQETKAKLVTPDRIRDLEDALLCVIYEWWDNLPESMWIEVEDDENSNSGESPDSERLGT